MPRTWIQRGTVAALVLTLPGCALGQRVGPLLGWPGEEPEAVDPMLKAPTQGLSQGFLNPSFEQTAAGRPVDWPLRRGEPLVVTDPQAPDGQSVTRVSLLHHYQQDVARDIAPWQTVTIGVMARGHSGIEVPRLSIDATGRGYAASRTVPLTTEWGPVYAAHTETDEPGDTRFRLELRSRLTMDWIDFDDVVVLHESPADGDFERAPTPLPGLRTWALHGGATHATGDGALVGNGSLRLPPGAHAVHPVAHASAVATYFVAGVSTGPVVVEERRLDSAGLPAGADSATSATLTPGLDGWFSTTWQRPTATAHAAELEFRHPAPAGTDGADPVMVDEVTRGMVATWPTVIYVGENVPSRGVRFAAAWPRAMQSVVVELIDADGLAVARLDTGWEQRDDSAWRWFDGGDLPAGVYTVRYQITSRNARQIVMTDTVTIKRVPAVPTRLATPEFDDFVRMAWYQITPLTPEMVIETVDQMEAILAPVKQDGFNMIQLGIWSSQVPLVREAMDRVQIPYMVSPADITGVVGQSIGHTTWDPAVYLEALEPYRELLESPWFRGIYVFDEPNVAAEIALPRTNDVMRLLEVTEWPHGYSVLNPNRSFAGADFTVISSFYYPFFRARRTMAEEWRLFAQHMQTAVQYAMDRDRPYWLGTQTFSGELALATTPTPARVSIQHGMMVAMGARGYFGFLYGSLTVFNGLRRWDMTETPRTATIREFNRRIDALWPTLRHVSSQRTAPPQTGVFARVGVGEQDGAAYLYVVSQEEQHRLAVTIDLDAAASIQWLESGETTPPAERHTLELAPGDWVVGRLASGTVTMVTGVSLGDAATPPALEFPVVARIATTGDAHSLALNPARDQLAAAVADGRVELYDFDGNQLLRAYQEINPGYVRFLEDDLLLAASRQFGERLYDTGGEAVELRAEYMRHTGTGFDMLLTDEGRRAWIASGFRAVSRATLGDDGSVALDGRFPAPVFDFRRLFGPYQDGSVLALEQAFGLFRVRETADGLVGERLSTTRQYSYPSESPGGRIAVGNWESGVTIFDPDPAGTGVAEHRLVDPHLVTAEHTAWLSETLLAVGDVQTGVRFYRVQENGAWSPLGIWALENDEDYIASLAAREDGLLAVGISAGGVVLLDTAALLQQGTAWRFW